MPRDVFISHSAQDKKVSETICAALEQGGILCWIAPRDVRPGKSFPGEITRAIQQSKVMLLIFSRHSNSSEQVLREVQLAVDCHLPIVRLRIEDIPLSDDLRYYLSTPHWLDALTSPLSKHIPPLVAAIKELLGQTAAEAQPDPILHSQPPEVVMKQRPPDVEQKAGTNWRGIAIGAAALAIAGAVTFWVLRSPSKSDSPKPVPADTPGPSPTAAIPIASPTPAPSPTAAEVTPTPEARPSPTPNEPNRKGPGPRNNPAWQVGLDGFGQNLIASSET